MYRESAAVFTGAVEAANPSGPAQQQVWVRVGEVFKANIGIRAGAVVELTSGIDSCTSAYTPEPGVARLFYVSSGSRIGGHCHGPREVNHAAEDLLFLRALPKSATTNRLSGLVSGALGRPAPITITPADGNGPVRRLTRNADGVFEIYGLPDGEYTVAVEAPAGLRVSSAIVGQFPRPKPRAPAALPVTVRITRDSLVSIHFSLDSDTHLSGYVFGNDRKPVTGVCVELEVVSFAPDAANQELPKEDCTNWNGYYRLEMVPPGSYRLVLSHGGRQVFYPGTSDRDEASIVSIRRGQGLRAVDFVLP